MYVSLLSLILDCQKVETLSSLTDGWDAAEVLIFLLNSLRMPH